MTLSDIDIRVENFKCFGGEAQGLNEIKPINLLIGRNNSGKSSLIDLVEYLCNPSDMREFGHNGRLPKFIVRKLLKESELRAIFKSNTSGGLIGGNHWEFGKQFVGKDVEYFVKSNGSKQVTYIQDFPSDSRYDKYKDQISKQLKSPFQNKTFRRLSAERDISPETDSNIALSNNGSGATNIIQKFLNKANYDSNLVEKVLLDNLNSIMEPDSSFDRILVQQYGDGNWEVFP